MLEHGGRLRSAAAEYGVELADWLDLSTGLAPYGWPIPAVPMDAWMRLPEEEDGLEQVAASYYGVSYGVSAVLPVAGSQAAIQALPGLFAGARVGIVEPCYAEHRQAWTSQGFASRSLLVDEVEGALDEVDVLVVVNPNNPTGKVLPPRRLLGWHEHLAARGGCLVIDEAFCDLWPELSLAALAGCRGLVVLRSLGKFFGLAGARLGFVLAEPPLIGRLRELLGPWAVSGPARRVGLAGLEDRETQALWRMRIEHDGNRLERLLGDFGLAPAGNAGLFVWVPCACAAALHRHLASQGILVRHFPNLSGLRFGLPATEAGWRRLEQALGCFAKEERVCRP